MTAEIHVCMSCQGRAPVSVRAGEDSGDALVDGLRQSLPAAHVPFRICEQACFGPCGRGVRLAVTGPGRWSWLFEDLRPGDDLDALAQFLAAWWDSPDGVLAKAQRPARLFRKTLGRVPPSPQPDGDPA